MTCKCCGGYGYVPDTDTPFPSPDKFASSRIKPCPVCCKELTNMNIEQLKFKKYPVLDNGFICLVDAMGDDSSIVQAARVSYGNDKAVCPECQTHDGIVDLEQHGWAACKNTWHTETPSKDRALIRYLLNHSHTTPFEMVEIKFMVQAPMDCWRQWIRHRTANVNEYSTRYTEAIDMCQTTAPDQWRLQATDNKQGSSGFLTEWPKDYFDEWNPQDNDILAHKSPGHRLSIQEKDFHEAARAVYQERLDYGVAKEQARKDLPLSTYTRAYWKCDLHNIFNFLRLRMDSHAQYEIRSYANAMYEIVKQIVPVACEAFEDCVLNAKKFSAMEMNKIRKIVAEWEKHTSSAVSHMPHEDMTSREWSEFCKKVGAI